MAVTHLSTMPAPEGARLAQLQAEIDRRGLLKAFGETSDLPARQLSSEALLTEYGGHLTTQNARLNDALEELHALLREFQSGIREALASIARSRGKLPR
jgi:hypothetical protein